MRDKKLVERQSFEGYKNSKLNFGLKLVWGRLKNCKKRRRKEYLKKERKQEKKKIVRKRERENK